MNSPSMCSIKSAALASMGSRNLMPPALHYAGMVTFNYWANRAFADLITRGQGFASVLQEFAVLAVITVVGLVVAIVIFTIRQRRGVAA